eukprot:7323996-Pyramimonas_sp.AAC.1
MLRCSWAPPQGQRFRAAGQSWGRGPELTGPRDAENGRRRRSAARESRGRSFLEWRPASARASSEAHPWK